jgi:hypothetical protein
MQRLSAWARWIASAIFTGVVLPLLVYFVQQQPPETAGAVLKFFLNLAEQTWLRFSELVLAGFVAGLWLDWFLRRLDRSRSTVQENIRQAQRSIGIEMQDLASKLENASPRTDGLPPYYAELLSNYLKLAKLGIWTPDPAHEGVHHYLKLIGTLLSDGHLEEAKQVALFMKERFYQAN